MNRREQSRLRRNEVKACRHYRKFLRVAVKALSNKTTFGIQLQKYGRKIFGLKFHGVYMSDQIPRNLSRHRPYAIVNLDKSTGPGSHWIAVAYRGAKKLWVYDSFGDLNKPPPQIKRLYPRSVLTDPDAEQSILETNCGARAMAWLMVVECFPREALLI